MVHYVRLARAAATAGLLLGSGLPGFVTPALARSQQYRVEVDNKGPRGHDFEYVDYFPRSDLKVHGGDVVDFRWNTGSQDGLHTVTFLPQGSSSAPPLVVPDSDDPGGQLQFNPAVLAPSNPTCGTQSSPCTYDGSQLLNSGAIANAAGGDFFVRVSPTVVDDHQPTVLSYLCEIHPGMAGSITVVSNRAEASDPEDVRERAEQQLDRDTQEALRAEDKAERTSVTTNPNGTRTLTMTAGTATQFVEVAEMLPRNVTVRPGDSVQWVTKTLKDPHTVTFPDGTGSDGVDPLPSFCEGTPDTAAVSPAACPSPTGFEVHLDPQPQGPTTIASPQTVATSGVIANPNTPPSIDRYTFSFPNAGTFDYQCRIHDHMVGTVVVRS
jgi:plastocyanin